MKKRLLITSIVMMLVCAVALSTATYAWFTSNTTVSASTMTLKAATSDKSALGIGWTGKEAGTYIVSNINAILDPMAPQIKNWDENSSGYVNGPLTDGLTTYEITGGNQKFYTSNIKQEGSVISFSNEKLERNPVVYTEEAGDATKNTMTSGKSNSFYIVNMSTANVLDSVVVSGVFTDYGEDSNRYIMADTSVRPDPNTTYYLRNADGTYSPITEAAKTTLDTNGFDNLETYYIRQSLYVLTSDTKVKEDTTYYTNTSGAKATGLVIGADIDGYLYEKVSENDYERTHDRTVGNKTYYTDNNGTPATGLTVGDAIPGYLYEKRDQNGDDMLRIAIFTKEYRYTADTSVDDDKTYWWIHPSTGLLTQYTISSGNPSALKLLEAKTENHTLRGVIGKYATKFTPATGTTYDMNTIYYEIKTGDQGKERVDVSAGTFADMKAWEDYGNDSKAPRLFTKDGSNYVAVAEDAIYNSALTYYKNKYSIVAANNIDKNQMENYFVASNTVVNGEIEINDPVTEMYYYTNVTKSIDLWDVYDEDSEETNKCVTLKPGELIDIIAVIWLDGTDLDDTRSDEYAQVSLKFDAVRNTHSSQNAHQN